MDNEDLMKQLNNDINTLSIINDKLENVPQEVENAKITSPVASVESSLAKFFDDAIKTSINDFVFNSKIQQEIENRLPTFNNAELITLLTNNKTSDNDMLSKILGPSFTMITTKQQAEIAAAAQINKANESTTTNGNVSSIKELNANAPKEILKGMQQLYNMLNLVANKDTATDVKATIKPDKDPDDSKKN